MTAILARHQARCGGNELESFVKLFIQNYRFNYFSIVDNCLFREMLDKERDRIKPQVWIINILITNYFVDATIMY